MIQQIPVNLAFEDALSEAVLERLILESKRPYVIGKKFHARGFGWLRKHAKAFNNAAKGMPYFLITDLDVAECAPLLIREWLPVPKHPNLVFRVACREVEAWLLADRARFAAFLGVSVNRIPVCVDGIADPKQKLINLVCRFGRGSLKKDIVPRHGSGQKQGPGYNEPLCQFVREQWRPAAAKHNSPSLARAYKAVLTFEPVWQSG